ncbi:hypothetical protein LOK49_LG04G03004 [Camellia lanceoleosa]|uniref:Uncharacterized protein n=1 Tax=Camellia lanceoleosa TaxID=1840588 RepID=A0ACC0I3F0_9ERIC|nr:hypothetical protein LOK49_LG04G03004 [Camellia lanceoleosa]
MKERKPLLKVSKEKCETMEKSTVKEKLRRKNETHVDWSEGKWHPKSYRAQDITYELMRNITLNEDSVHVTSDERKETQPGMDGRNCYSDEHYLPTFFHMLDPSGIAN